MGIFTPLTFLFKSSKLDFAMNQTLFKTKTKFKINFPVFSTGPELLAPLSFGPAERAGIFYFLPSEGRRLFF